MSEEIKLNGDIEVLKSGDFTTRVNWFHREFSNDIENAVKTGQQLMYFWAIARLLFKGMLFRQSEKPVMSANLVKEAGSMAFAIWGDGDDAARAMDNAKQMSVNMAMCLERLAHTPDDEKFIETFSSDDNPKDFRSAICRTLKEWESEKDIPDSTTQAEFVTHRC